jgi:ATP-dependent RNA helicase RhlE
VSNLSFRALGVSPRLTDALAKRGIEHPFRIQELVLPDALAGRDVLAKAPTGSGKTIAFALPLAERTPGGGRTPAALVLVPTRELAVQVAEECNRLAGVRGLRAAAVYGGVPVAAQAKRARGAEILIATPGRLQDLMERRLVSL